MRLSDWSSDVCSSDLTPQPAWLGFAVTGKARAAIRRHVRSKEKVELAALGRTMYDEMVARLPNKVGDKARAAARERLKLEDASALYVAIAKQRPTDTAVLAALGPGTPAGLTRQPGKPAPGHSGRDSGPEK